jgi:DNA polymerase-1
MWKSDVKVEAFITGRYPSVELSYLVESLYGAKLTGIDGFYPEASQKGKRQNILSFGEIPLEVITQIAAERAHYVRKIHQGLYDEIADDPKLKKLHRIEMDLLPIAVKMQQVGIRIDSEKCHSEYARLMEEAEVLSKSFHGWLQRNFNITDRFDFGSSHQTADLLIDKLHIFKEVKTAKGNRSTSKKIFEGLRDSSPAANAVYTYRELIKICSGFYGLYPKFQGTDGRLHPKLLTTHVISGRTASAEPNCQQIPKESRWEFLDFEDPSSDFCAACPDGACKQCNKARKKILRTATREVFIPRDGFIYVEGDYSQIELMVLAGVSGEPKMIEAFRDGLDIHSSTASLIYSLPPDQVSKRQRQVGKTTNFRFNYGGGAKGLSDQLGISLEQAFEISRAYSKAYPVIDSFAQKSARDAFKNGYVETLFGRRRYMEEFKATDAKTRARGRRLSVNLQIQGGAADIAKIGLIWQDRARKEFDIEFSCKTYLINFIHDSFMWEIPVISEDRGKQDLFVKAFIKRMRGALCFDVSQLTGISQFPDLRVDFKAGKNYHAMVIVSEQKA